MDNNTSIILERSPSIHLELSQDYRLMQQGRYKMSLLILQSIGMSHMLNLSKELLPGLARGHKLMQQGHYKMSFLMLQSIGRSHMLNLSKEILPGLAREHIDLYLVQNRGKEEMSRKSSLTRLSMHRRLK